jgi:hypothetical protein
MFNQLTSIVDRNFVVGFYIPALILMVVSLEFNHPIPLNFAWVANSGNDLSKATVFAAVTLVVAFVLQTFTLPIYRFLEGYWPWGLSSLLRGPQLRRYRRLAHRLRRVDAELAHHKGTDPSPRLQRTKDEVGMLLATRFPSSEDWILPTAFGNVLRSFEDYSHSLYGIEAVEGWSRLNAVIPKDFLDLVNSSQALCDLLVVSFVLAIESAVVLCGGHRFWAPVGFIFFGWFALRQAIAAAMQWGSWVKAAFDVFLPALAQKLGYQPPQPTEEMQKFWQAFSSVIIYRREDWLEWLEAYRVKPSAPDDKKAS